MNIIKLFLAPIYALLETHQGYELIQRIGAPTVRIFREILSQSIQQDLSARARTLDLACGSGGFRELFPDNYYGIDINPDYIEAAAKRYKGYFQVMNCQQLQFEDGKFDSVVTIATTHHLDDFALQRTLFEALRVLRPGGKIHIIDAILPKNRFHIWKEIWFRCDRGNFPRRAERLLKIIDPIFKPTSVKFYNGSLHDVIYICHVKL